MKTPYTQEFLESQREVLLSLRDALNTNNYKRPKVEAHADEIDAASSESDFDFALSMLSNNSDAILDIHSAIQKIDQGTYGICEVSGKVIPKERLLAIPFAKATVECQAKLEKQQRIFRRAPVRESVFANERAEAEVESPEEEDIEKEDGPHI